MQKASRWRCKVNDSGDAKGIKVVDRIVAQTIITMHSAQSHMDRSTRL